MYIELKKSNLLLEFLKVFVFNKYKVDWVEYYLFLLIRVCLVCVYFK